MPNQYVNKVIYGGSTLIDLTADTVTASDVLTGVKFHLPSGAQGTGSCAFDVDSSNCTATVAEVLATKTFAKNGSVLTGTMPNRGAVSGTISDKSTPYTIPQGYHDGSGTVGLDSASSTALVANNIREGVEILGITGTMSGSEGMKPQSKTVTPSSSSQTVLPDSPTYNCLSQVTVNAIPYTETDNAAGGKTVTIG
jgi:hypothetical protein